jgi:hypothetical protein
MNFTKTMKMSLLTAALATFAASTGQAAVVDLSFGVTTWSNGLNGATGSNFLPVEGAGFTYGGVDVFLAGGFFHDGASSAGVGTAVYSLAPTTYGPSNEPSAFTGSAVFSNSGYQPEIATSISGGNIGFKTTAGNYGYVVFDWDYPSRTMTFVEGAYESDISTAITTPSAVPLPAALPLLLVGLGGLGLAGRRRKG